MRSNLSKTLFRVGKKRNLALITALLAGIMTIPGCNGGGSGADADRPARTPVSGKVTHNGDPVEGATVVLSPTAQGGKPASGLTDASGMYTLRTFETDDGAIAGEYKVTVTKLKVSASSTVSEDDHNYDHEAADDEAGPEHLLPEKYSSAASTDLTATIPAEGEVTDLNFDLVD